MDEADLDKRLRDLAERQHSLVSWREARSIGASAGALRRRSESTDWEWVAPRVLRLSGSVANFEQRCMAAALDAGPHSAISHHSAARLWRLPGFADETIHISRRRRGGTPYVAAEAIVHGPGILDPTHVAILDAIPLTTVARTVFDLAGIVRLRRVERALDSALARGLTTTRALHAITEELAEHGRPGSTAMRELLAERDVAYVPPESGLEARFITLLRSSGLPEPARQVDLGGDHWVGRVDFVYRDRGLVIEIDSAIHHTTKIDRDADRRRDAELAAAGFRVLRVTEDQVWFRPRQAVAAVRTALGVSAA